MDLESAQTPKPPGELYPPIEPYNSGFLKVSDIHEIYYEECGNKDGNPIVYLHGGPGAGCHPNAGRFFDPAAYRIILLDQRGAGRSKPTAELKENTTWDLVSDLEKLREYLGVTKWVVFGGSWGSTLALSYAETHPDVVKAIVIWGVFTFRRNELEWLYKEGASYLFPDKWKDFIEQIPEVERGEPMNSYYRRLTGSDKAVQLKCARAWTAWELNVLTLVCDPALVEERLAIDDWILGFAKTECHYFVHGGWFPEENYLLDKVDTIRHIPATIIQGRYDVVTPTKTAWDLHEKWPEAEFHVVPGAGHFHTEPGIQAKIMEAAKKYEQL